MRLEPVFVLAPKLPSGSVPTRRAFLCAGAAFFGGAVLGTACGYSLGAASAGAQSSKDPASPAEPTEPPKTGNAELDELRRLAVGPIDKLLEGHAHFLVSRDWYYRDDKVLWQGVARLSELVVKNESLKGRRLLAKMVLASIENGEPPPELDLGRLVPELRKAGR